MFSNFFGVIFCDQMEIRIPENLDVTDFQNVKKWKTVEKFTLKQRTFKEKEWIEFKFSKNG